MDNQQTQRVNEAAQQFAETLMESYRTITERNASVQHHSGELTQNFFNTVISNLYSEVESNRAASQNLAEQTQRGQEATQILAQEFVGAYMGFLNSMFSFYQESAEVAGRGTEEAASSIERGPSSGEEAQSSAREDLRSIIRESTRRSAGEI